MNKAPKSWIYKPVEVLWIDTVVDKGGWELAEEFSFDEHEESMYHTVVGKYMGSSKKGMYVCQLFREKDAMCGGRISIPLGCVVRIRRLR